MLGFALILFAWCTMSMAVGLWLGRVFALRKDNRADLALPPELVDVAG